MLKLTINFRHSTSSGMNGNACEPPKSVSPTQEAVANAYARLVRVARRSIFARQSEKMIYVSRKEHFNAAHKLYNPAWTREKNVEVFGPCANENWHGHNFELIVTVGGTPDPFTGFVVDLKKLSTLIRREVIEKLDHRNLNVDVDFMAGKLAS